MSTRPLALSFPLHGSRLIEASAGTGKTFTISALYLRLILQHGGEDSFSEALLPPQILVVTFTDAATRELRDRIRLRLVEAAEVFRGEREGDALLQQLRGDYSPEHWPGCAQRLQLAAQWMDEAAVSTIHSWCQRMLREHAFDSGSLFSQTLETDHSELYAEVVRDYWRQHCYRLTDQPLVWVDNHWGDPQSLSKQLRHLPGVIEAASESLHALLEHDLLERRQALAALKAPWGKWLPELQVLLDGVCARKQVNGRKLQARYYNSWLEKIGQWAASEEQDLDIGAGFERLTPQGMAEIWTGAEAVFEHPALEAIAALPQALDNLPDPAIAALKHAAAWVAQRFELEKRRRAEMGFDDMLTRLDTALQGDNGPRLAEVIRRQFPVAMIDEFQDTDPLQYRIFDTLYQVAQNRSDCGLFMIGDPKQAIYAFRGADIYTYLRARQATLGRHYNLDCNYRSSIAMVDAVNALFEQADQRGGQGPFLFRDQLPFISVGAAGRPEQWCVQGQPQPALTLWQLTSDAPLGKDAYRTPMAESCASEITRLLIQGQNGEAGFVREGQTTGLKPSDIAVLVRDFSEAQAIGQALSARGVRSVYLSDKDSVFASAEARDVLLWLRACAEPDQDRALRAALASSTLGLSLAELEQLNLSERDWELRVLQFRDYRHYWQQRGVLPMLRRLLQDFELPQRLMGREQGERVLTNLLHLAELLQQAAAELDGEQALLRYLSDLLAGNAAGSDEQVLRLESDESLVRVVTIHKSKGLEYPLVFLPFICSLRPIDEHKPYQVRDGEQRRLVLRSDPQSLAIAEHERLAEDLRLLYVALTRARHGCWLGLADIKLGSTKTSRLHDSAIGYLLGGGGALEGSEQLQGWLEPLTHAAHTQLCALPEATSVRYQAPLEPDFKPQWRTPNRRAAEHWWIASYSALRLDDDQAQTSQRFADSAPENPAMQFAADDELAQASLERLPSQAQGLHRFPRGPNPGTFLHGLLEWVAEEGFAEVLEAPQALREMISQRCHYRGWQEWIEPLCEWLPEFLREPVALTNGATLRLTDLSHYQAELEFWFEACAVDVERLDALVQSWELPDIKRQPLRADCLNGMFKGFIDLVFEYDGRYYVADYKSNWLGASSEEYNLEAMTMAIAGHRYDLQYVLYVLALHRQLRLRLPDYDYQKHMGGALYLFVRAPGVGCYHSCPPPALIEQLDALFMGTCEESPA